jgi:hypothetical protein
LMAAARQPATSPGMWPASSAHFPAHAAACMRSGGLLAGSLAQATISGCYSEYLRLIQALCGRWVMFYEAVARDNTRSIGMALSRDGRSGWRRLGRPVLEAGPPGAWDAGGVGAPCPVSMAGDVLYPCCTPSRITLHASEATPLCCRRAMAAVLPRAEQRRGQRKRRGPGADRQRGPGRL